MTKEVKNRDDLEKMVSEKVENIFEKVDKEIDKKNTKIITVDIDKKSDLIRKYSDKKVSKELLEYLIDRIDDYKWNDKVKIVVNKRSSIEENSIRFIKDGLKVEHKNSLKERDETNLKQIWLLCMGILLIFLSTKIPDTLIWKEVLLITGWVPIWEMMEMELFPDAVGRKRRKCIKKLLKCEIVERSVNREIVESIEISQGEELIDRR